MQTATHAVVEALQNAKRFTLTFKNAAEDIPRLITCYGRCCGGELALVLRPDEGRGAFVKVQKDKAVAAWWGAEGGSDALKEPEIDLAPKDAVKRIKVEQMAVPRAGAITLKGQWKGHLTCQPSGHQVVLQRKIASYGNLFVMSSEGRWTWRVVRDERWFTPGREKWGGSRPTLKEAIQAGLADAMNVLGDACSVRDSHRRAALDTEYATEHPIQPAKEGKDPIERLKERPEKVSKSRRKKGEAGLSLVPAPLASPLALPAPPTRLDDLREAAGALSEEVSAYTRLKDSGWTQSYTATADLWYGALLEARLDEVVTRIQDWFDSPSIKPAELLDELHAKVEERDLTPADRERAVEALEQLERELKRGPALLTRARWLIRYAANAVSSRLCQGRDREEASAAIEQAAAEYEAIRQAIEAEQGGGEALQEEDPKFSLEMSKRLRTLGKGLALTAAKLARSCATGQQTVTALADRRQMGTAAPAAREPRRSEAKAAESTGHRAVESVETKASCPCGDGRGSKSHRCDADHKHGRLVVVPIFGVPKTAGELRDHLVSATSAFKQDPSIRLAKRWVKTALQRLELELGDIKGNNDGAIGVYVVQVSLKSDVDHSEVKARLALLHEAVRLAGVAFRVVIKGVSEPDAAVPKPTRERRTKATTAKSNTSSAPADSHSDMGEVPADPAQDAIIMDAITSAIQKALGNGGN